MVCIYNGLLRIIHTPCAHPKSGYSIFMFRLLLRLSGLIELPTMTRRNTNDLRGEIDARESTCASISSSSIWIEASILRVWLQHLKVHIIPAAFLWSNQVGHHDMTQHQEPQESNRAGTSSSTTSKSCR